MVREWELSDGDIETVRSAYRSLLEDQVDQVSGSSEQCLSLVICQQECSGDTSCQDQCYMNAPLNHK